MSSWSTSAARRLRRWLPVDAIWGRGSLEQLRDRFAAATPTDETLQIVEDELRTWHLGGGSPQTRRSRGTTGRCRPIDFLQDEWRRRRHDREMTKENLWAP